MKPKVTLLAHTTTPIETIYQVWELSKGNLPLDGIREDAFCLERPDRKRDIFERVVEAKIPVAENLDFVFLLENVSISFREQMVRHRIGVKVGERIGIDMVPDLADSTWWSQSMRILDMGRFATERAYREPNFKGPKSMLAYEQGMHQMQDLYNFLIAQGESAEDAREVIPLGATHRITWKLNLAALQHIVGKRGCWILQGDLWEPIIRGMVEELATKVDPYFRTLIAPPCVKGGKYQKCVFEIDNDRRLHGLDDVPPCALFVEAENKVWEGSPDRVKRYNGMKRQYENLWGKTCQELISA